MEMIFKTVCILITISNALGAVPVISDPSGSQTVSIAEDTAVGTSVYNIVASDSDNDTLTYSIPPGSKFVMDANILKTSNTFDYEDSSDRIHTAIVTVDDSSGFNDTVTITVNITDVNDNSPVFSPSVYTATISENSASGVSVVDLSCSDIDSDVNGACSLSILSGDDTSAKFQISGTTLQTSSTPIDYETLSSTLYSLVIIGEDSPTSGSPNTGTAYVYVTVSGLNEDIPTFDSDPSITLSEDTVIGYTIYTYTAQDTDSDPHNITKYEIASVTNGGANIFSIEQTSGDILLVQSLDYESTQSYVLIVVATDGGGSQGNGTVTVSVSDINDNTPTCSPTTHVVSVYENETVSTEIINDLQCSDSDSGVNGNLTYTMSVNPGSKFEVSETGGIAAVVVNGALDYETTTFYQLEVTVSDNGSPVKSTTVTVNVNIQNLNEHYPVFTSSGNYAVTLSEDTSIGSTVTTINATDDDTDDTVTFGFQETYGNFEIDTASGVILLSQSLDRETNSSYTLLVTASDEDGQQSTGTVSITITDVNDNAPICLPSTHVVSLYENETTSSDVISDLQCSDSDSGVNGNLTYTMSVNPGSKFEVSETGGTAAVIVNDALDYETTTFYQLEVTVSDNGSPAKSTTVTVNINIQNVNEHYPVFTSSGNYAVTLSEDTAIGTTVTTISATDDDTGDSVVYGFDASYSNFEIDTTSGVILLSGSLDRETNASHTFLVTATDGNTPITTGTVVLTVSDVNESPVFSNSTYSAFYEEEQSSGTSVIQVSAIDQDTGSNGNVTYSLVSGDGISFFDIDSNTGEITTTDILDYEVQSFYSLIVQAADGASPSLSTSCLVTVALVDINDNAPVFVPGSYTLSIYENSTAGVSVTTVTATDSDSSSNDNNIFDYSLTGVTEFEIGNTTGIITTTNGLDREIESRYELVILAIDKGSPSQTGTVTITVTLLDINDNDPVVYGTYDVSVSEDTPINTIITTIIANDTDYGDNSRLTYNISNGDSSGDFKIESGSGIVQTANSLDRETIAVYYLEISIRDNGSPSLSTSMTVTITVNDINDNYPLFTNSTFIFEIEENVSVDTVLGYINATDLDEGVNSQLTYEIVGLWTGTSNPFVLNSSSGEITVNGSLDRETESSYYIWCRVSDAGSPLYSSDVNVTVSIIDVNDNDPMFGSSLYSDTVVENSAIGTSILTVSATDADINENAEITYSIDSNATNGARSDMFFAINSTSGELSVKQEIDREVDEQFTFIIYAVDGGSPARTASSNITITIEDVNDNLPIFSPTFYNSEVPYSDSCSSTIVTLTATDADIGENSQLSYSLQTDSNSESFSLDSATGSLTLSSTLSTNTKYVLYATALDNGNPQLISNVSATIRVDSYSPDEVVISFYLALNSNTFSSKESTFLNQLTTVYQVGYSTAYVRRWCIEERSSNAITVHVYVIKDDLADTEEELENGKSFLTTTQALSYVTSDSVGTPSDTITGTSWDEFQIQKVTEYNPPSDDTPWIQTPIGIAVTTICAVVGTALLIAGIVFAAKQCGGGKSVAPKGTKTPRVTVSEPMDKSIQDKHKEKPRLQSPEVVPSEQLPHKKEISFNENSPGRNNYITNRNFDGRVVDSDGRVFAYNTKTNERKLIKTLF